MHNPDTWAVLIPGMGNEFHRVDSLDYLYGRDTIVGYGLSMDTSWILYRRLKDIGMDAVLEMSVAGLQDLVSEIKNMSWSEAAREVKAIKQRDEGHKGPSRKRWRY